MSTKVKRVGGMFSVLSHLHTPGINRHISRSPGYALSLLAESTTSAIHCAEAISRPGVAPEEIGLLATQTLLEEIQLGGCIDRKHQSLVLLMMVLGSEDVGRCRMGQPTRRTCVVFWLEPQSQIEMILQDTIFTGHQVLFRDFFQNHPPRARLLAALVFMLWNRLCEFESDTRLIILCCLPVTGAYSHDSSSTKEVKSMVTNPDQYCAAKGFTCVEEPQAPATCRHLWL